VLGYNATTSFALLSIPITLPAEIFSLSAVVFPSKICIFLPVDRRRPELRILWLIGGRESMKRGAWPAVVAGLSIAACALGLATINYASGGEIIPIRIIGIVAGLFSMGVLILWAADLPGRAIAAELTRVREENPIVAASLLARAVALDQSSRFSRRSSPSPR